MNTQSSASPNPSTTATPQGDGDPRPLASLTAQRPVVFSHATLYGLAGVLAKLVQVARRQDMVELAVLPLDDRRNMLFAAARSLNALDPTASQLATTRALERAEAILDEEGFIGSVAGRTLARRIAHEAICTHQRSLEGVLDAGGVQ